MKITTENNEVFRHNVSNETEFNIKGSAKAFKILSDGLYSDKILAVIRELACNAKDSHIDANKNDVPFEVHLPNSLEPWFAVTDFGLGLSTDDVLEMYSTYFESTKTESNDVTGCLGLGSKSPFAYADSFTVESRWNGELTFFNLFYNKKGIPTVVTMGDPIATDLPNGLTVKMAAKDGDMREFAIKARRALNRFSPAPIVTGNTDYKIDTVEYTVEGSVWKMIKGGESYGRSNVNAIQGNVTYPVAVDSMPNLTDLQRTIMQMPIDMFFEIGDLDVAANREALGYDESTIKNITDKLDTIAAEVAPLFQDKFNNVKTLWDARVLYKELVRELPTQLRNILGDEKVGLKWKNAVLNEKFSVAKDDIQAAIMGFEKGARSGRGQTAQSTYDGSYSFSASNDTMFFYDNVGHGSHSRVTHFLETSSDAKKNIFLFKTDDKKALKKISGSLGNVVLQPVSNLEKRPAKLAGITNRVYAKVLKYVGYSYDRRDSWEVTDCDLKTGGIYVTINRYKVFVSKKGGDGSDCLYEVDNFNNLINDLSKQNIIDMTDKTIYGVRKGDVSKLKKSDGWIDLFDLIEDNITKIVKKENIGSLLANTMVYNQHSNFLPEFIRSIDVATYGSKTVIGQYKRSLTKLETMSKNDRGRGIQEIGSSIGYYIKETSSTIDLDAMSAAIEAAYPMLSLISDQSLRGGYYRDDSEVKKNLQMVSDYIKVVDSKDAKRKTLSLAA